MVLWAGVDEAGYGPKLGPLVVAGTAFDLAGRPQEGILWRRLRDAVCRRAGRSDGRLVVNDSKQIYSSRTGLKRLEEGVLAFLAAATGRLPSTAGGLLEVLESGRRRHAPCPWFRGTNELSLPAASNPSAIKSKAQALSRALGDAGVRCLAARAVVVYTPEFNRIVARTRNKSYLLFQKSGLLLQEFWSNAADGPAHILVDRHGGRIHYRDLLLDAFPGCSCDVRAEDDGRSVYSLRNGGRLLHVGFIEKGDCRALPTALGSMIAKYVRELHMQAFNSYWRQRHRDLKPTAGYFADARRWLRDARPALEAEQVEMADLVRIS